MGMRMSYRRKLCYNVKDKISMALSLLIIIFWLIFWIYWIVSAVDTKQNVKGVGSFSGWLGGRIIFAIIVILFLNLPQFSGWWNWANSWAIFQNLAVRIVGVILAAAGISFAIWARRHLGRDWSGTPRMKVGHELVTSGPYRFVRHPIYTGMLAALFGSALVAGPIWFVVFVIAAAVFIRRIGIEEKYMMELFPDQYPAYRARTKTLVPGVW
jgi:protein-S-isoprenylcysteine O-methyltransferase Ste14